MVRRNINNFRYADDSTLMAESEEELKSLLMKVTEVLLARKIAYRGTGQGSMPKGKEEMDHRRA